MSRTCVHFQLLIISIFLASSLQTWDAQAAFHVPVDRSDSMTRLDPVPVSSTGYYRQKEGEG